MTPVHVGEGVCMTCGAYRQRELHEVTAYGEDERRFIAGRWEPCTADGYSCAGLVAMRVPALGPLRSCAVPTPDEILRAAGVATR